MAEYLISFNAEWVPEHTPGEIQAKARACRVLISEMKDAGVFIFSGGLDADSAVFSVDASGGEPIITDGPFIESKEHLGGFAVIEVDDEQDARFWAGKLAIACGWPQEVHRFGEMKLPEDS